MIPLSIRHVCCVLAITMYGCLFFPYAIANEEAEQQPSASAEATDTFPVINKILVQSNRHVSTDAIIAKLPCRVGQAFTGSSRDLIRRLFFGFPDRFNNIIVYKKQLDDNKIDLLIVVEENIPLKEIRFEGNSKVTRKEIEKKIAIKDLPAIAAEKLEQIAAQIHQLYMEKGYLNAKVTGRLEIDDQGKATALFTVEENNLSLVKRVIFKGNQHIPDKHLRDAIFTREDWILGFMDNAGTYHPDKVQQGDRIMIEQCYQNRGYPNAKVPEIEVIKDEQTNHLTLVYNINEGDAYTIKEIHAPDNELFTEQQMLSMIQLQPGQTYSRQGIVETMKELEKLWGNYGYLYAHVSPSVELDDATKTVTLGFHSELGKPVFLNTLTIRGNEKTQDKVILRKITLQEGDLITPMQMDMSRHRVESLGFFDQRDGVTWKTHRLSDESADLELVLKEIKTGSASLKITTHGDDRLMMAGFKGFNLEGNISNTNLFGSGVRINATANGSAASQSLALNIVQPYLFDKPIYGAFDLFHRRVGYDEFTYLQGMNEKHTGVTFTSGLMMASNSPWLHETLMKGYMGVEGVSYDNPPRIQTLTGLFGAEAALVTAMYTNVANKLFRKGVFGTIGFNLGQDRRNHPMNPNRGYAWSTDTFFAFTDEQCGVGFFKTIMDASWYTTVIEEYNVVFKLHAYLGFVKPFANKFVPYRDLFNIGGPATVRGFLYGQIGPQFDVFDTRRRGTGDSIGATKAFVLNAEFGFPIKADYSIKGVAFYDGGAGWDNPYAADFGQTRFLKNNTFDYRHAVGVGVRVLNPAPIRIDIGFKLDPRKGEAPYEVHFGMNHDF